MINKVSVIIPTYNGEEYIQRTINSIMLYNNPKSFELIIINDGSKDRTAEILEENKKRFNNMVIINKDNSGVSDSRNVGIMNAKNSLIMFCDDDDEYEKNLIDNILDEFDKNIQIDLMVFGRYDKSGNNIRFCNDHHMIKEYNIDDFIISRFCTGITTFSVCNKIYRNDILKKENIYFDKNLKISEDLDFNLNYMKSIKRVEENFKVNYIRYCNEGSTLYKNNKDFFEQNIILVENFEKKYKDFYDKEIFNCLYNHFALVSLNRLFSGIDQNNKKYKDFKNMSKKIKNFLDTKKINFIYNNCFRNIILFGLFNKRMFFLLYIVSVKIGNIIRMCRK